MTTRTTAALTSKAAPIEQVPCLCGCLGMPKGKNARYLPGHDARHHAALKRAASEAATETRVAPKRVKRAAKSSAVKGDGTTAPGSDA